VSDTDIGEYAFLSDRHCAALVSLDGSVDWLCFPRFDSPAVFAAMLGDDAGRWAIQPVLPATVSRHYLDDTLVLQTRFVTQTGTCELTDALVVGEADDPHALGEGAPHVLARSVACTEGFVELAMDFRPRAEYGLVIPVLSKQDGGLLARGGPTILRLSSRHDVHITEGEARARFTLHSGQTARFALHWAAVGDPVPPVWSEDEIGRRITATVEGWRKWSAIHQAYDGPWRDLVRHSGRVLFGLGYQPTGAIVAAATTSLPETVGGTRNWDYRYTWIRDAAFAMNALWVAACPDEAHGFFQFITTAAATVRPDLHLQIMYGVGGEHDLTERTLEYLPGWRGSTPVRVGNAAWQQNQLDVYGELLHTAARYRDHWPEDDDALVTFLTVLADTAAEVWREPDHGIWEIRGEPQHFLHSKLMCWVALEHAVNLADKLGRENVQNWTQTRDAIRTAIEELGWNPVVGAYTQAFGSNELDASTLMMPIMGFVRADDPRMLATIEAVARELSDDSGLVYRYRVQSEVDGLRGQPEGAFLICTFWLVRCLALAGQLDRARELYERAAAYANDLGLLAEQADPQTGALLGNFPQALSHIGLINAAHEIGRAAERVSKLG
jgi:GH15 family glucan-1,4-alpha-glucosidase